MNKLIYYVTYHSITSWYSWKVYQYKAEAILAVLAISLLAIALSLMVYIALR